MNCMKCGRELREGQVFCDECLDGMEDEPIRINTAVHIPAQPPEKHNSHRRPLVNPEEEIKHLEKVNQNLILWLVLLGVLSVLFLLLAYYQQVWAVVDELGRNYSVLESVTQSVLP